MSTIESGWETPKDVEIPLPIKRVTKFSARIAHGRNLDTLTSEVLTKFAVINYRIKEISTDFRGTTRNSKGYLVHIDEQGAGVIIFMNRNGYSDFVRDLSAISFNLYNTYLSKTENTRAAAREVQVDINDLFPQFP